MVSADWKYFAGKKIRPERERERELKKKKKAYNQYLPKIESCKDTGRGIVVGAQGSGFH